MAKEDARVKRRIARLHDYQTVFESVEGRRVLADLMDASGFLQINYVPSDPTGTAFNEGKRAIVVEILKNLKVNVRKLEQRYSEAIQDADTGEIIL